MIKLNNTKGFTLIELMIVIAIIGLLAAIAIPNFISYRNKAYCSRAETDAQSVLAALSSYFADPNRSNIPTSAQLKSVENLTLNRPNSVTITAEGNSAKVEITEGNQRCPASLPSKKYTVYFGTTGTVTSGWK
jgi:prepilin-type N-terminal cleavage/methylation domain-containing protein